MPDFPTVRDGEPVPLNGQADHRQLAVYQRLEMLALVARQRAVSVDQCRAAVQQLAEQPVESLPYGGWPCLPVDEAVYLMVVLVKLERQHVGRRAACQALLEGDRQLLRKPDDFPEPFFFWLVCCWQPRPFGQFLLECTYVFDHGSFVWFLRLCLLLLHSTKVGQMQRCQFKNEK